MNTLLGSAPKATFRTDPTISPIQQATLPDLLNLLQQTYGQAAPGAQAVAGQAQAALPGQLAYQAPQITAPQIGGETAFQTGVVQPVTQDFLQRSLPAIAGNYGRGAGGAFGSEGAQTRDQAATDVSRSLAQEGTKYQLATDLANQAATLSALQSNLTAANQAAQIRNQALGFAPSTAGILPAAVQPTLQDLLQAVLQQTQQTSAVGTGGSTGLVQGLLSAAGPGIGSFAGSTAGSNLIASLFGGGTTTFPPLPFA